MIRSLLSVSIFILLFTFSSCKPTLLKGYKQQGKQTITQNELPPLLPETQQLQKYNMTFDFRKKHFSGLLLVKRTEPDSYRLLFNSHFGMSLFDIEINADSLQIHQCIEPLQKKQLFRLLKRDFSMLLGLQIKDTEKVILYANPEKPDKNIYKLTDKENKGYYLYDTKEKQTEQILSGKALGKTLFCHIPSSENETDLIKIIHCYIGLVITLQSI